MGKIAIYTRVSSVRQLDSEGESLKVQREECEKMLIREYNKSKEDFIYFTDEGISGKSTEKRDQFVEMLEMIKNQSKDDENYIEGICCFDLSRLARNLQLTMEIFNVLKENNLKLYTVDRMFRGSLDDQSAMIMIAIIGMLNELYLVQLREKVIPGMKESSSKGYWQGGMPPLGYDYLEMKDDKGRYRKFLVINEKEAEVVKRIFHMYVNEEKSLYSIAKELNDEGYKTKSYKKRKGGKFSTVTVTSILSNPVYIGKVVWGKKTTISLKQSNDVRKKEIKEFTDEEIRNAKGIHEAIIDEETFFKARARMKERKQIREDLIMAKKRKGIKEKKYYKENRRIFSNVLRCPECGSRMTSSPYYKKDDKGNILEVKYSYICSAYNSGKNNCKGYYRVSEKQVYEFIRKDFIERMDNYYKMIKIYLDYKIKTEEDKIRYLDEVNPEKAKKLERLEKNKKKLSKNLENIAELIIENKDNKRMLEIYNNKSVELNRELDQIENKIQKLKSEIEKEKEQRKTLLKDIQEKEDIGDFEVYFNNLSIDKQRELIEQVYTEIVVDTEPKRQGKQKNPKLRYAKINEDFSIRRICEILDIDFNDFFIKMQEKGIQLPTILKYFEDGTDFVNTLIEYYKNYDSKNNTIPTKLDDFIQDLYIEYKKREEKQKIKVEYAKEQIRKILLRN
ncbi:Site-specific DNA recombinase [Caloranaerobacter azorensis DSM 13643]|uniref:Site-specific DNA recombinase n=1 Tax=Caloranaerobacter azorensis DSM 13643 TaxID=1121264 RepID=A0A1M5VKU1_9FIRM|nr:recombinase family protein [Caloranaerobacter azorensis]SHH75798.1 Site-specific DNA recombinase [Caloranaerobacter azorensis DSM 13643]